MSPLSTRRVSPSWNQSGYHRYKPPHQLPIAYVFFFCVLMAVPHGVICWCVICPHGITGLRSLAFGLFSSIDKYMYMSSYWQKHFLFSYNKCEKRYVYTLYFKNKPCAVPMGRTGGPDPPPSTHGKSQVAIGFLRNSGTNPHREPMGPLGSNCFSREVRTVLCNTLMTQTKTLSEPPHHPGGIFWI